MQFNKKILKDMAKLCSLSYKKQSEMNGLFGIRPFCNNEHPLYLCKNTPKLHVSSDKNDCQVYTTLYDNKFIAVFRGTESGRDILTDLNMARMPMDLDHIEKNKRPWVHWGFLRQFRTVDDKINIAIKEYINNKEIEDKDKNIIFCGHSLGGALSSLACVEFSQKYKDSKIPIHSITFGSPRVGSKYFAKLFNKNVQTSYRFVNDNDPVPLMPTPVRYSHVNGCVWLYEDLVLNETSTWRWWRFVRNFFLSFCGNTYNPLIDHKCDSYITDLNNLDF
tara:strand:- start:148 stop:978 length:831 start_codon:yes stop_codon:yes gene_type:complete